jgi:hypothetical protein
MTQYKITKALVGLLVLLFCNFATKAQISFQTKTFKLSFNGTGRLVEALAMPLSKSYLPANENSFLLSVKRDGKIINPEKLEWKKKSSEITLFYPDKNTAVIKANQNATYVSFELMQLTNASNAELILWGPYPTTIGDTIGEVVGVVRNKDFAIGIQALNIKTLGGYPSAESDIQPSYDVFAGGNLVDIAKDDYRSNCSAAMWRDQCLMAVPYKLIVATETRKGL